MKFNIRCSCVSHVGKRRRMNQDNFIFNEKYLDAFQTSARLPAAGTELFEPPCLIGVFDGMGGEERGEMAALIAAETAAGWRGPLSADGLLRYCREANDAICRFADGNGILSMGATAALLAFSGDGLTLSNIGDSRILRLSGKTLEQISVDHCVSIGGGGKPPLTQNLGIPPAELIIEPYIARAEYRAGDIYLICSDGLTDMVSEEEIARILRQTPFDEAADRLLQAALDNGGRDNITIALCRIEGGRRSLFRGFLHNQKERREE